MRMREFVRYGILIPHCCKRRRLHHRRNVPDRPSRVHRSTTFIRRCKVTYTKMLRMVLGISWKDKVSNITLYGCLPRLGSRNPLRTSTWCGLVGTNGRCAPLLSAKVGICQLKISIGTRKSTLTATKHQYNSLSDIRLQDSTRTMMTRWRFAEDFSRKPHRSSTRCALVGS